MIAPGLPRCYDTETSTFVHSIPIASMLSGAALAFDIAYLFHHRICMHTLSKSMENKASSALMTDQQGNETQYRGAAPDSAFVCHLKLHSECSDCAETAVFPGAIRVL